MYRPPLLVSSTAHLLPPRVSSPRPRPAETTLTNVCEPIIAGDHPGGHDAFLAHLRAASSTGAPCTAVWMAGSVAYRCRTCQTGEQSSVCVSCFRAGDHAGHDYIMYRSETGGVCDCGDLESWAEAGCCPSHAPRRRESSTTTTEDARPARPETETETETETDSAPVNGAAEAIIGVVLERLLLSLESVARARGPSRPAPAGARRAEEERVARELLRWLTREADAGEMRAVVAAALTREWIGADEGADPSADEDEENDENDDDDGSSSPRSPSAAFARMMTRSAAEASASASSAFASTSAPRGAFESAPSRGLGGYAYGDSGATIAEVRRELRRRRVEVKRRAGCPPSRRWPISGGPRAGLLDCLLRATCLPSLPDALMERATTFLLVVLFSPECKVAFAAALTRHYRDAVLFPETLPWPGVRRVRRRGGARVDVNVDMEAHARALDPSVRTAPGLSSAPGPGRSGSGTDGAAEPDSEFPSDAFEAGASSRGDDDGDSDGFDVGTRDGTRDGTLSRLTSASPYAARRALVSRCMDRVTVQLFGSAPIVAHAVAREGLLDALVDTLGDALGANVHVGPSLPGLPRGVVNPDGEGIRARLFARPCNDLRMCLAHRPAAHRWLGVRDATHQNPNRDVAGSNPELESPSRVFLETLECLRMMQGMNPRARKTGDHVERESQAWVHAITAETFVLTTLRAAAMSAADGSNAEGGADVTARPEGADAAAVAAVEAAVRARRAADADADAESSSTLPTFAQGDVVEALLRAARATIEAACAWTDAQIADERATATFRMPGDDSNPPSPVFGDLPDVVERDGFSLARSPFTEHLPLHRLVAILLHAAAVAERAEAEENEEEKKQPSPRSGLEPSRASRRCAAFLREDAVASRVARLAEHPSRALAWSDQVRARLWVRNGDEMRRAAAVYGSARFSAGLGRDADLATTQMALATAAEPHLVTLRILQLGRASCLRARPNDRHDVSRPGAMEGMDGPESARGGVNARKRAAEAAAAEEEAAASASHVFDARANDALDDALAASTFRSVPFETYQNPKEMPSGALECARGAARTLATLARYREWLTPSTLRDRLTREIAHLLAASPRSHSELGELLPSTLSAEQTEIDAVLRDVAAYTPPRGLDDAGAYALAPAAWGSFDPFFHRYTPAELDAALQNATRAWCAARRVPSAPPHPWHPRDVLRPPPPPPPPFDGATRFLRHESTAAFCRDCACALARWEDASDLQDAALSAMALVAHALLEDADEPVDDAWARELTRDFAERRTKRDDGPSIDQDRDRDPDPSDPSTPSPFERALTRLGARAGCEWSDDESHATILVAECASSLAATLRARGVFACDSSRIVAENAGAASASDHSPDASGWPSSAMDADAAAAERRERVKARQRAVMEQMAARQRAFRLAHAGPDDSDDPDDPDGSDDPDDPDGSDDPDEFVDASDAMDVDASLEDEPSREGPRVVSSRFADASGASPADSVGACCLCRGSADEEATLGPLCWVATAHRTNAPAVARRTPPNPPPREGRRPTPNPARDPPPGREADGSLGDPCLRHDVDVEATSDVESDPIAGGFSPDFPAPLLDGEGAHVLACGHAAHAECHARYLAAAEEAGAEGLAESRARVGLADGDFHCPTCRRMCNVLVPIVADPPCRRRRVWDRGDDENGEEDDDQNATELDAAEDAFGWTPASLSRDARALDRDARERAERARDVDRDVSNPRGDGSDLDDRVLAALRRRLRDAATEGPAAATRFADGDDIETDDGGVEWLAVVHGVAHAEVATRWRGDDDIVDGVSDIAASADSSSASFVLASASSSPSSSTRFPEPAAATAANSGRWRALRELTTLAMSAGASGSARDPPPPPSSRGANSDSVSDSFEEARLFASWVSGDDREGTADRPDPDATSRLAILSDAFARARRKYWRVAVDAADAVGGGGILDAADAERTEEGEERVILASDGDEALEGRPSPEDEPSLEDAPNDFSSGGVGIGVSSSVSYAVTLDELFRKDPPAFVAEMARRYARASPGVFTDSGGLARLDVIARVAVLAAVERAAKAIAAASPTASQNASDKLPGSATSPTPSPSPSASPFDLFVRHLAPVFWRVEALLSLADGASTPPPSAHPPRGVSYPTRAALLAAASLAAERCGDRLFRRLGVAQSARDAWRVATTRTSRLPARLSRAWLVGVHVGSLAATSPSAATPHPRPRFAKLPRKCEDLYLKIVDRPCDQCGAAPRDPAVCLACGELVCCAGFCCRAGRHGETARHAAACGAGAGAFFLVKSTRTLLLRGRRVCLYPSVYLDAHGEEDEFLKRGRPLFLSEERFAALEELWVQSAFDYDSLALQNSRLGSDFY